MSPGNEGLVRPFLNQSSFSRPTEAPVSPADVPVVRAFMMTNGRTASSGESLPFESMVSLSPAGLHRKPELLFEQAKIAALTDDDQTMSIAEVSAKLRIPLGTAQVLCGDMVNEGLLEVHKAAVNAGTDVSLLTRLINGVRAL
jgi:Protein of unknown function (DUF742)